MSDGRTAMEARVEFWKRLNGASSTTLAVTLLTAVVALVLDHRSGADF